MKERLLVLAKAAPEASKKYEELVCVAGITESGEWRRIYPIPWEVFWKNSEHKFPKKSWIEYELEDKRPNDSRPESRSIKFDTIKLIRPATFSEIEGLLRPRLQTIEEISQKGTKVQSLGVVEPKQVFDYVPVDNPHYTKLVTMNHQQDLFGQPAMKLDPPKYKYQYLFKDDATEKTHEMLCEDWEALGLYRNCEKYRKLGKYPEEATVHAKVKERMKDKIFSNGHVYFIVGSHFRFPTFMVVGVIYPKKSDLDSVKL